MAGKHLTRFVIEVDGELKRLFSVREVKRGLLTIKTDANDSISTHEGQQSEILTLRHTVHTSERSETNANLVHMTQEFANGTTKQTHLLTHAARDGTFIPIYQRTVADPRRRPSVVPHHKDSVVSLGTFDPNIATLVYGVWLSSASAGAHFPPNSVYSNVSHTFQRFSLSVAYGFVVSPSTTTGTFLHYATSSPEKLTEIEKRLGYRHGITPGASADELPRYIVHELNEVIELLRDAPVAFGTEMMRQKRFGLSRPPLFVSTPP